MTHTAARSYRLWRMNEPPPVAGVPGMLDEESQPRRWSHLDRRRGHGAHQRGVGVRHVRPTCI